MNISYLGLTVIISINIILAASVKNWHSLLGWACALSLSVGILVKAI